MRRLRIDQPVTLSLDEVAEPIACQVRDVTGAVARLTHRDELPPRAVGRLALGSPGYLVFDEFRLPVGLRVAVRASPPYLDAAVMDGIALPERRADVRVSLVTRVRLTGQDAIAGEGQTDWTETVDLSEQGAKLRNHPALAGQERFSLELMFGEDPQPVAAQAKVVRSEPDIVGVVFESVSPDDATRLAEYLTGFRHLHHHAASH